MSRHVRVLNLDDIFCLFKAFEEQASRWRAEAEAQFLRPRPEVREETGLWRAEAYTGELKA